MANEEVNKEDGNTSTMIMVNADQFPYVILRGEMAGLSALRSTRATTSTSNSGGDAGPDVPDLDEDPLLRVFFDERGGEPFLASPIAVTIRWNSSTDAQQEEGGEEEDGGEHAEDSQYADADDDIADEAPGNNSRRSLNETTAADAKNVVTTTTTPGILYLSSSQILFVAQGSENFPGESVVENDVAIGASCIILHAMMDEPEPGVYLQLTDEADDSQTSPLELSITPIENETVNCQQLFDCICRLVSQWPVDVDDDDDQHDHGGGGGFGFAFGGDGGGGDGGWMTADGFIDDDGDDGRDDLVWALSTTGDTEKENDGGATVEERAALLERLDNLLVVPQEMEIPGQFDDAD
jgi:Regulator of volume decrease after cellular swelling